MTVEQTITVELTEREARALARAGDFIRDVLTDAGSAFGEPVALDSARMKLYLGLMLAGAEL